MAAPFCGRMGGSIPENGSGLGVALWPRWCGVLLALFLCHGTAAGRIGETEAEVKARYGAPVFTLSSREAANLTKCLSDGFSIAVTYVAGRSAREMIAKADKSEITEKEINRLLEANSGGFSWNPQQLAGQKNVPDGLLGWRTNEEKPRIALYDERTQALFVTTQRFINLTNAANRRSAAKKVNGGASLPGGQSERALRNLQSGNLRGFPTSSPARKGEPSK
ncbi:MAG: hypothetical protein H0W43_00345 [Chthoniobacterales bacterium]|nr:hypothetical protein [Chthoniobacterales bacterium]